MAKDIDAAAECHATPRVEQTDRSGVWHSIASYPCHPRSWTLSKAMHVVSNRGRDGIVDEDAGVGNGLR